MSTHTNQSLGYLAELRKLLMRCDEFASHAVLQTVFVAEELFPFRTGIPEATALSARVDQTIAYLYDKRRNDGRSALVLFLLALSARYDPDDDRHQSLITLAEQFEADRTIPQPIPLEARRTTPQQIQPLPSPLPITFMRTTKTLGALCLTLAPVGTRCALIIENTSSDEIVSVKISLHQPQSLFLGQTSFAVSRITPGSSIDAGQTTLKGGKREQEVHLSISVSYRLNGQQSIERVNDQFLLMFV